jgi:pyridoxine 5-phosphate synthase
MASTQEMVKIALTVKPDQVRKLGLDVHAGHGLTYQNVAAISEMSELNIGHNIVARAVLVGMERAVRETLESMRG